ncbi:MAG: polysaccharide pyruvyl transferase family protein, partial [Thermodesulfobacteriota bacterium]
MKICLFDPGFADNEGLPSLNLGDVFIQDAVNREIKDLFDKIELTSISTHTFPPDKILKKLNNNSFIFLGGTNILSSNLNRYRQWRISVSQMLMLPRVILFGVGWHSYQGKINTFSRLFLNFLLSKNSIHSVRDSYTQKKLKSIGFKNVCNTGCPTMWPLQNYTSDSYPVKKAKHALVMLTDYAKDRYLDYRLLNIVKDQYEKIFFWPQGSG